MNRIKNSLGLKLILPIALLVSVVLIVSSSIGFTLAYIVARSNTLTNTFIPRPNAIFVEVEAEKVIEFEGDDEPSLAGFDFLIIDHDRNDRILKTTDESGTVVFALEFNEEDAGKRFKFTIEEVQGENEDFIYSDKVYEFEIEVTLGTDNKLYATIYSEGEAVTEFKVQFVNVLKGESGLPPTGVNNVGVIIGASLLGLCLVLMVVLSIFKKRDKEKK